jgi:hypothetical protein
MQLIDYIEGKKHGKEANRLEREAMDDPFLQGALEGFNKVEGDHVEVIKHLEKKYSHTSDVAQVNKNALFYGSVAATILLLIVAGAFLIIKKDKQNAPLIVTLQLSENESEKSIDSADLSENDLTVADSKSVVDIPKAPFGEKEFIKYCQQTAGKNVCYGQSATVKVSFFIDETGKPTKIECKKYSCEEAKKEIENLLASSPVWTKTNRKVTMTVKW